MKHYPRVMNRLTLFLYGLVAILLGTGLILLATWKKAAQFWQRESSYVLDQYSQLTEQTRTTFNPNISWLTIAFVALAILISVFMLIWIFRQGGGSTKRVDFEDSQSGDGTTIASIKFVDALINDVIENDKWILSAKPQGWKVKRQHGLAIKVVTVKGADPLYLKNRMDEVIARLDSALGKEVPVCIHFTTGWKTTFAKPDRVD